MWQAHRSPAPASLAPFAALLLVVVLVSTGCATPAPSAPAEPPAAQVPPDAEPATTESTAAEPPAAAPASLPEPAPAAVPDSPPSRVRCFLGGVVQRQPDGTERSGVELLVRRSEYRDASKIVEDSVRYDPGPRSRTSRYQVVMDVDPEAGTFTLRETDGLYTGRGELEGEPWEWEAWTYSYRLDSGIAVQGRTELRETGDGLVLYTERQAYGPDGGLALTLVETLPQIEREECEARLAEATDAAQEGTDQ